MKQNQNSEKKGFSVKDITVIVLCLVAMIVLLVILKQSNENKQQEQYQLNEINEQIQQNGGINNKETSYAGIVINEVNQEGWIELYNGSKNEINLKDVALYINGEYVKQIKEDIVLPQGAIYVLETGMQLASDGHEIVVLKDVQDTILEARIIPQLEKKESYGSVTNGSAKVNYQVASKGKDNAEEKIIQKEELTFSVPGGFYANSVQLELLAPDGMDIYYTLDGSDPTLDSNKYSGAILISNRSGANYEYAAIGLNGYKPQSIDMGTVVRAIAVDAKGMIVEEKIESYFIGLASNSDMINIPVLSITTDPDNLFDYFEGIYVLGRSYEDMLAAGIKNDSAANYLNNWKKTAHIEFFEANKDKTYESDVELSLLWDDNIFSRQKGFCIEELDIETSWEGSEVADYFSDKFHILNVQTNRNDNAAKIREYLANELLKKTTVGTAELMPINVFIDGEYWGLYMLRKPYKEADIQERYDVQEEKVIFVKNGENENWDHRHLYEEFYQFMKYSDMSIQANYEKAKNMMDIQSYLDYFCANMYLANANYGIEGSCMWRTVNSQGAGYADGKWRWLVGQMDHTMGSTQLGNFSTSSIDTFLQEGVVNDYIFMSLRKNEEFREQFRDTMYKMQNEIFTVERVAEEMNLISEKISKAATSTYERFTGAPAKNFYSGYTEVIDSFFEERGNFIGVYVEEICIIGGRWDQFFENLNRTDEEDIVVQ